MYTIHSHRNSSQEDLSLSIIVISEESIGIAQTIRSHWTGAKIYTKSGIQDSIATEHFPTLVGELWSSSCDAIIFVGATGVCVRYIAPYIQDKHSDPAVVVIDSAGHNVISLLSGHVGGANMLTQQIAHLLGAYPVVTTKSDCDGLWALDVVGESYGWVTRSYREEFNTLLTLFVRRSRTALLLEDRSQGADYLRRTAPDFVDVYTHYEDIDFAQYELLIALTPRIYPTHNTPTLYYHPRVLHMGVGCRKQCSAEGVASYILDEVQKLGWAPDAITSLSTIELKKDEPLLASIAERLQLVPQIFTADDLKEINVPNPSEKVLEVTTSPSVSEASALCASCQGVLVVDKQKGKLSEGNDFTFALAWDADRCPSGHIEIVGAGPGDPELISVKGKHFLEQADLILYAGSLVPIELTYYAKEGAVVRSSADLNLEEQFELMKSFYDEDKRIVRLHTGDPCIYGAIQEQMALFDAFGMSYHITPGISSFQAAAAALRSQFTIPEKVQTIILTRGEGRTPMPEKEQLHLLARSQSTMCIFLSAGIVDDVQAQLLEHYPPTTPVAACYKLTWKDQRIYRGELQDLSRIVKENHLTLTTMIVVGDAIDNRAGLSRLYADEFKHLFRR